MKINHGYWYKLNVWHLYEANIHWKGILIHTNTLINWIIPLLQLITFIWNGFGTYLFEDKMLVVEVFFYYLYTLSIAIRYKSRIFKKCTCFRVWIYGLNFVSYKSAEFYVNTIT